MRLLCLYIIIYLLCWEGDTQILNKKQTKMIIEKFGDCPVSTNLTIEIRNFNSKIDHGNLIMNYETHILKDTPGVLDYSWEIQRCTNRENLDSCIMFSKIRTNKFCNIISSASDAWTPFLECVHPKMICPLKKGVYAGRNCSIDPNAFKLFPLGGAYWRVRAKLEQKSKLRMCCDIFGYIRDV